MTQITLPVPGIRLPSFHSAAFNRQQGLLPVRGSLLSLADRVTFSGVHPKPKPTVVLDGQYVEGIRKILDFSNHIIDRRQFAHGLILSALLLDNGASQNESVAAALFGVNIGQPVKMSFSRIRKDYGLETAEQVKACSDFYKLAKETHADAAALAGFSPVVRKIVTAETLYRVQDLSQRLSYLRQVQPEEVVHGYKPPLTHFDNTLKAVKAFDETPLTRELARALTGLSKQLETAGFPPGTLKPVPNLIRFSPQYTEAMAYALELHKDQARIDTLGPYALHLLDVSANVIGNGGSEAAAIAALVHDGPEDQGRDRTLRAIGRKFGPDVRAMVKDCTQPQIRNWFDCKKSYFEHIPFVKNPESLLVISADKRHNLQTLFRTWHEEGDAFWEHFWKGKNEQLWFYQSVVEKLEQKVGHTPLVVAVKAQLQNIKGAVFAREAMPFAQDIMDKSPALRRLNKIAMEIPPSFMLVPRPGGGKPKRVYTEAQQAIHAQILAREFARIPDNFSDEKVAHIVTGLPAAGKSCFVVPALAKRDHAVVIDADIIKPQLPGYHLDPDDPRLAGIRVAPDNGIGATSIHAESSMLSDKILAKVIQKNASFVIPHTGRDLKWDIGFIKAVKAKGYKVFVHHIEVPPNIAISRTLKRFDEEGRFPPPEVVGAMGTISTDNFMKLKEIGTREGFLDGYTWTYNGVPNVPDVPVREKPILVEAYNASY